MVRSKGLEPSRLLGTTTSRLRVYQFHHERIAGRGIWLKHRPLDKAFLPPSFYLVMKGHRSLGILEGKDSPRLLSFSLSKTLGTHPGRCDDYLTLNYLNRTMVIEFVLLLFLPPSTVYLSFDMAIILADSRSRVRRYYDFTVSDAVMVLHD